MFAKNVTIVVLYTALAQVIPLLMLPILTRISSPDALGGYLYWHGIVSMLVVLAIARYDFAIFKEKNTFNVLAIIKGIIFIAIIVCVFVFIFFYYIKTIYQPWSVLESYAVPVALSLFCMAIILTLQAFLVYTSNFNKVGIIKLVVSISTTMGILAAALVQPSEKYIVYGHTVGLIVALIFTYLLSGLRMSEVMNTSLLRVAVIMKKHYRFPLFSLPADFSNMLAMYLPSFIILDKYGVEFVAIYALTIKVMSAPISLIAGAIMTVFKDVASDQYRRLGHCREVYLSTFKKLLLLSILPFTLMFFMIEPAFILIFGPEYGDSGKVAFLMLPLFALKFVSSPLSYTLYLANWQRYDLLWQLCLLSLTFYSFYYSYSFFESIKLYVQGYSALYIVYFIMSYKCSKVSCL